MNALFESALITAICASTIRGTTPILLAALGGLLCERVLVFNIVLEGTILVGAFAGVEGGVFTSGIGHILNMQFRQHPFNDTFQVKEVHFARWFLVPCRHGAHACH